MSDIPRQAEQLTAALRQLQAMQTEIVETVRTIEEIILLQGHPEMVALDEDLDTMYRGQL